MEKSKSFPNREVPQGTESRGEVTFNIHPLPVLEAHAKKKTVRTQKENGERGEEEGYIFFLEPRKADRGPLPEGEKKSKHKGGC